ncbi:hypothetical protein Y1Q_0012452 [Alligator mississippiensis]|uniref:Uncharacterized protein n=1 Tax=Alligator mississippiensis TaxID=8496 RepID=A0A151M7Q0_ALLMI|nr:hypothetical protein Y1Q_0012452 [Alligator mississippiensis]
MYGRGVGKVEPHEYPLGGVTNHERSSTGDPTTEDPFKVMAGIHFLSIRENYNQQSQSTIVCNYDAED